MKKNIFKMQINNFVRAKKREILAFTHIPKAAGTTLEHLLRSNFFARYCEVRILSKNSKWFFEEDDMRKMFLINPFLKCIAGHDVRPYGSLVKSFPNIKFITLFREPVERYISHSIFKLETTRDKYNGFDDFLNREWTYNLQTKRIAGSDDLNKAKDILTQRFILAGIVEEFDGFLILLKRKLKPMNFRINYKRKNVGKKNSTIRKNVYENIDKWNDQIKERNNSDIELYRFIKKEILPKEKKKYGSTYEDDLKKFKMQKRRDSLNLLRYFDYMLRRCYYTPVFNLIRKLNKI